MEAAAADEDAINSHQCLTSHPPPHSCSSSSSSSSYSPAAGASQTALPIDCCLDLPSGANEENDDDDDPSLLPVFRPFTEESLRKITKRVEEEARRKRDSVQQAEVSTIAGQNAADKKDDEKQVPNPIFEVGRSLPSKFGNFPSSLYGRPIEDLDEYYKNRYTFMIVARDKTMFRFSATKAFFLFTPFHPVRRTAMYILTHPLIVMVVILVNCVFMAGNHENPEAEKAFTGIYTLEGIVKMFARGFILANFTYLRDAWNWLDFCVVVLAYLTMGADTMGISLGNVAVLRTFRVLRALKTVAVVPGLKTIVGALMEAVRRLRDVMILSLFVLSIFALIGLQLYQGSLKRKCIRNADPLLGEIDEKNATTIELTRFRENDSNWYWLTVPTRKPLLCGPIGGSCPANYTCWAVGPNPDFTYTNFDNFGWAMLCAFRLMTQDAWENLYQQVLRTNGPYHVFFFIIVIFLGSFYLVNVILAIVAMSYDDCRRQDQKDAEQEREEMLEAQAREAGLEEMGGNYSEVAARGAEGPPYLRSIDADGGSRTSFDFYRDRNHFLKQDEISMKSEYCGTEARRKFSIVNPHDAKVGGSLSLPGSPFTSRRSSSRRSIQFRWKQRPTDAVSSSRRTSELVPSSCRPMVVPCLDNLDLPFADDSEAVTPTSDDMDHFCNTQCSPMKRSEMHSVSRRLEELHNRFSACNSSSSKTASPSRNSNRCAALSSASPCPEGEHPPLHQPLDNPPPPIHSAMILTNCRPAKPPEPTHFHWNSSLRRINTRSRRQHCRSSISTRGARGGGDGGAEGQHTHACDDSSSVTGNCDHHHHPESGKELMMMMLDNPFLCRTPSAATVDLQDVLVLKDLVKHASGKKRGCFGYEKGMDKKEFIKEKCMQLLFGWECFPSWYKFAHLVELFIMDAFVDLFITICIVINTVFMAMEHDSMNPTLVAILKYGNYVFTGIFTVEASLKILALGLYKYLQDNWSCFDFVIVLLSLVELGLENVKGLSILRSFRLLRVFKLAKSWPTLNLLIGIIGRTMGALGNLCFVLAIIIFIFAVMGMQLFGTAYNISMRWHFKDFLHSFMIVFRILCGEWIENMWMCIVLCGHHCIPFFLLTMIVGNLVVLNLFLALLLSSFGAESLRHSQEEEGPNKLQEAIDRINRFTIYIKSHITYCVKVKIRHKAAPPVDYYYDPDDNYLAPDTVLNRMDDGSSQLVTIACPVMGNGRVVCQAESIPEEADDSPEHRNNIQNYTLRLVKGTTKSPHVGYSPVFPYEPDEEVIIRNNDDWQNTWTTTRSLMSEPSTVKISKASSRVSSTHSSSSSRSDSSLSKDRLGSPQSLLSTGSEYSFSRDETTASGAATGGAEKTLDGPEINEVNVVFVKYPDDCCPRRCITSGTFWDALERTMAGQIWWKLRCYAFALVEHPYFETFIIIMILASSLALAVEDREIEGKPNWKYGLKILDKAFTVIFVFEMVVKMGAYGFKKYFTDAWCWLDFIIVAISLVGWFAEDSKAGNMGAFRALRTLRALRPLRAVSRWEGMKVVVNALIQAIPAIFNVLLVCLVFWLIFSIMGVNLFSGRYGRCLENGVDMSNTTITREMCANDTNSRNLTWFVPKINFDNVLIGYLALFQVATFKGWMDIMYAAIDSANDIGGQPSFENRVLMYLYFVLFIVFGSFFTLNLFIGVIIENFNMQKKKAGGSLELLMTEDQKKYYNAMKKLGSKEPTKPIPKPKLLCQLFFFKVTKNQKFDIVIMIFILLNMMTMAMEHHDEPQEYKTILGHVNCIFIVVFTLEFIMKLLALRQYYFKEPWNVFDFVVVVGSILTWGLSDHIENLPISPTLLRVIRVFRVGRVLRLVKSAKGIRTLLFSLAVSMPALFNIGLLLFLVMFIYAIVGMSSFMHVKHTAGIDDMFNFETFFKAMIILFQTCTSAGWSDVLAGLMNDRPPDCNPTATEHRPNGDCGNSALGIMYLVSYLVISFLVIINMYIAVILENFSQATEDVQQGLTQDDFDMYYEIWERFDEKATQFISVSQLSEFVDTLEDPLRLPVPNRFKLISMNIPICDGDRVHCVDILDALTKNFLGTAPDAGELGDLKKGPDKVDYHPISTTLKRQREIEMVRLIQRTWRNYRLKDRLSSSDDHGQGPPLPVDKKPEVNETADVTTENNNRFPRTIQVGPVIEIGLVDGRSSAAEEFT